MYRKAKWLFAAMLVAAVAVPSMPAAPVPATASDSPLSVVPAQSPIVLHVKGVERVKGRVATMLKASLPDMADGVTAGIDSMFDKMLEGRKLTGVVPSGPVFIAFLELPNPNGGEPAIAVIFRVTKYTEFRDNFLKEDERKEMKSMAEGIDQCQLDGNDSFLVDKKDYAVIASTKEVAEALAKAYPGMDGKLPKEIAGKLLDNDVAAYVNLAAVNETYGEKIREGRDAVMALMDQGIGLDPAQADMAKKIYGGIFQIILDGRSLVAAFDFRPEGLSIHLQAQVGAESDTNQVLKSQKPVVLDAIGKLPAGQMTYQATDLGPEMTKLLAAVMKGVMAPEGETKNLIEAAYTQIGAAKGRATFASSDMPPAGITFQEFADPARGMAGTLAMFKGLGEGAMAMGGAIKGKPEIKADAETHRGIKFTSVRLAWDFDKMTAMIPGGGGGDSLIAAMKKLMGDGLNIWVGIEGSRLIQIVGKDWPAAKAKLDTFLDGKNNVEKTPAFQATKKQLPAQSSMLYFIDAGPITNVMVDYMVSILKAMPFPFPMPDSVKPVATDTAYIGMAVSLQPERGSFELFVPVKAIEEMKKVLMPLFAGGG
jgi:hypothetical protein